MKTIIVPTDFSAAAENAMLYAGQLAKNIDASILLLHMFQIPVNMSDAPLLVVSAEELKESADNGLLHAKEILKSTFPSVKVRTESILGDVVTELEEACRKENPIAIVVGKHGASGLERALFGSTSLSIIRHLHYPVIAVPDFTTNEKIQNVALAIDNGEKLPASKIKNTIEALKAKLHVIHVQQRKTESPLLSTVQQLNTPCKTILDEQFVHGIQSYISDNNIDLLLIVPHKHNLIERLFLKTHTPELLREITIPIMSIRED